MSEFSHLHCHTSFSLLDGAARIQVLVDKAKSMGMPALGITDHGNLFGVPEFYTTAKRAGVHPVIGCEFYLAPDGIQNRRSRTRYHQVLWAKNAAGYHNLMRLSSLSYTDGFYYKPRIDHELLTTHAEGLIATTCCLQGEVPQTILKRGEKAARPVFEFYVDLFGDDYYVELQDHGIEDQRTINEVLLRWARYYNVQVVATNDVHYVEQADSEAQDVLLCLQTGRDLNDPSRMRFENDQFYLKSPNEMAAALKNVDPDIVARSLETTAEIANKCTFVLQMGNLLMPHYPIPERYGEDVDAYLRDLVFDRAPERYPEMPQDVVDRLQLELSLIREMGYAGYFLIVQDFTSAARDLGVSVGPGRGSAAGSAVAYCLGITNIDPLPYGLLFERFLNPERVSMPDIDIDFDDRGRAAVIDYVVQKYGRENVCQIITFGTMGARSVIRDVARVLKIPLSEADRIAKLIPEGPKVTLASAMESVRAFGVLTKDPDAKIRKLMHYAEVLEGSARHTGVHAAGVIIAPGKVSDFVPVAKAKNKGDQVLTTQYDGNWVEKFGLLKMDFLGLSTLTVIQDTLDLVKQARDEDIDLDTISLDDVATFELFQRGETIGVFQFESDGMRDWITQLKPTRLDDLIAMNALYRPGPMELIPNYIRRKHGEEEVSYPHTMLKPVLEGTFGIPVYQEQVMQMAQIMGGYSLGRADILRRAMGKKKKKEMDKQREVFVAGARERNVDKETANKVFDMMAKFAGYGFNKCLVGETMLQDALTGTSTTLEDLFLSRREFNVHAVDQTGRLRVRPLTDVVWNGFKPVFELQTRGGCSIIATGNHPFLAPHGWVNLENLRSGDRIGASAEHKSKELDSGGSTLVAHGIGVYWDTVVRIVPRGIRETFDVTVYEDHNFVANGLVVHNSHSAAYSLVAYHTAYLKANFTPEFMAAAMTNDMGDAKKLAKMLEETRRLHVDLLPPSINRSEASFTVDNSRIRFGLGAIKGVGLQAIDVIVKAREKHGPARTIFGLTKTLDMRTVGKRALESLVRAGALDDLEGHRAQLLHAVETAAHYAQREQAAEVSGQQSLFMGGSLPGMSPEPNLPVVHPWTKAKMLAEERDVIGFYMSGHPLEEYRPEMRAFATATFGSVGVKATAYRPNGRPQKGPYHTFCGIISEVRRRATKKGKPMAYVTIEDFTGKGEMVCFSEVLDRVQNYLEVDKVVLVKGEVELRGSNVSVLTRDVIPMWKIRERHVEAIVVRVDPSTVTVNDISGLATLCEANRGTSRLYFDVIDSKLPAGRQRLHSRSFVVEPTPDLMQGMARLFGQDNISVEGRI